MARFVISTVLTLATLLLISSSSPAPGANAILVASNQFETADAHLSPHDHVRIAAGHQAESPFGSGCVGTGEICGLARSVADETERGTLRREHIPSIYQHKEDVDWQRALNEATPSKRLHMYYERLGGKDYGKKRELSQEELQRILDEAELEGENARADAKLATQQAREEMAAARRFRNRFRQLIGVSKEAATSPASSSPLAGSKLSSSSSSHGHGHGHGHAPGHSHGKPKATSHHHHHAATHSALSGSNHRLVRKRSVLPEEVKLALLPEDVKLGHDDFDAEPELQEHEERHVSVDDAFHAHLRQRFSRPWNP